MTKQPLLLTAPDSTESLYTISRDAEGRYGVRYAVGTEAAARQVGYIQHREELTPALTAYLDWRGLRVDVLAA